MPRAPGTAADASAPSRAAANIRWLFATLSRSPRYSRAADIGRVWAWRWIRLSLVIGTAIVISMFFIDEAIIRLMPPPGAPDLWPVRLYTDLGNSRIFLVPLGAALMVILCWTAILPRRIANLVLASLAVRFAYIFIAISLSGLFGKAIKGMIGRSRPFVGGEANAFYFLPFSFDIRFESFPSGHANTAFAAAFAIAAVWPQTRYVMWTYAVLMALSRIVLLAHHPSDVLGGAVVGVIGAMLVREWFAARRLGFLIAPDGNVVAFPGPSSRRLKRVVGRASAP